MVDIDSDMLLELLIATSLVVLTVTIHGVGLWLLRRLSDFMGGRHPVSRTLHALATIWLIVLGLFALHGMEIWIYAGVYEAAGAVHSLREGVYFSLITYGAIGYSDHAIAPAWQIIAGIEGINGVILIGWTTAFFVTLMGEVQVKSPRHPAKGG